jgi:hypothetical protein
MGLDGFGDLRADGHDRVEGGHGLLEDHGEGSATMAAHGFFGEGEQIVPIKGNVSSDLRGGGKQSEEGEGGGGFAGAGLADEAEGLAGVDVEGDVADGGTVAEGYGEIFYFEKCPIAHGSTLGEINVVRCW